MTSRIAVVNWDIDKVWYDGLSTSIAAEHSPLDPRLYNLRFIDQEHWYTHEDTLEWMKLTGRGLSTVNDLAQMLTDFFYGLKKGEEFVIPKGKITKEQIVQGKQAILRGLTMKQIKDIADSTEYNPGLQSAIAAIRSYQLHQAGFSDGLGPFVLYHMREMGLNHKEATPAVVEADGKEVDFYEALLSNDEARLTGKVKPYKKGDAIFAHADSLGVPLSEHAAIDDSAANIPTLKKIHEAGGVAVGYCVNDAKAFKEAGIPVLKGKDLYGFAEIVLDPSKLSKYCE